MEEPFIDRLAQAVYAGSDEFAGESTLDLMEECGVYPEDWIHLVAQCHWVCRTDFNQEEAVEYLDEDLTDERKLELDAGDGLTPDERRLADQRYCEHLLGQGITTLTHYYRVEDSQGRPIFFSSDHGDGGYLLDCDGPWKTLPEMTEDFDGECLREWTVL